MLREGWTNKTESRTLVAEYVVTMRDLLQEMTDLVHFNMERSQDKQKGYYEHGARQQSLDFDG